MDKSIAITDMGASRGDWALLQDGETHKFETQGLNALTNDPEVYKQITLQLRNAFGDETPDKLYYYGAGVRGKSQSDNLGRFFREQFPDMHCRFFSDLQAVVDAELVGKTGIVAILGTGSNAGFYNGNAIKQAVPALGYLLGDEGSGFAIGQAVVRFYLDGKMDTKDMRAFEYRYKIDLKHLITKIYSQKTPRKYIAGFAKFALQARDEEPFGSILRNSFRAFIERSILPYPVTEQVYFTGSVAYRAKDLLSHTLQEYGYTLANVTRSPLPGLIRFYSEKIHE